MNIESLYSLYLSSTGVCTDTRQLKAGQIFFALQGPNFDGNLYALAALEAGAAYAVVSKAIDHPNAILVEDALICLQALAHQHRQALNIPFIAITGSNGKTTSKELIHAVMQTEKRCTATRGNLNNHIGVPLTILEIPLDTEIAIIEIGANHQGEIASYCLIAEPDFGLITNIGKAHLEGFGGPEGVKKGKSELYHFLFEKQGHIFCNMDDAILAELCANHDNIIGYGSNESLPYQGKISAYSNEFLQFEFRYQGQWIAVQTQLTGDYNYANAMAAVCIGLYFGISAKHVKEALEAYSPDNNRSQFKTIGANNFILDAYNANPSSMQLAIENFYRLQVPAKIAILGGMKELGEYSEQEHLQLAAQAAAANFETLIFVGKEFKDAAQKYKATYFENSLEAGEWFEQQAFQAKTILLKGSRGTALEKILGTKAH